MPECEGRRCVGGALKSGTAAARGGLDEQQKRIVVKTKGMWPRITNGFVLCDGRLLQTLHERRCGVGRWRADWRNGANQELEGKGGWKESEPGRWCLRSELGKWHRGKEKNRAQRSSRRIATDVSAEVAMKKYTNVQIWCL
jgi:hypothetical protein